ncbi:hypothetical protein LXT21_20305 [Myxococcus sp. K38C18041901]|uniref:hypothetical protein n=1 Tax=Myxococcus guangdongensis TaxID=2906760 RepID=UPI0020A81078|nr:hypothetical protein [Myxococcus guangdongensis]MCP3061127.1 hypothetical protein [Myxococcus guangdongensis]
MTSRLYVCLLAILTLPSRVLAESFDRVFTYEAETELHHAVGQADGDGWSANTASPTRGTLVHGPYATNWGAGAGQAVFRVMIDDNTADNVPVAVLDVFCHDSNRVLVSKEVLRRDFNQPLTYQDFTLWFDLQPCADQRMEVRLHWLARAYLNIDKVTVRLDDFTPGEPQVLNFTRSSPAHVKTLVRRALQGLGFGTYEPPPATPRRDGPNAGDLVFVGRHYLAWIDQTGFYGKMNALWLLNGAEADALGFVHEEPTTRRPVSFLGVAEDGNGAWLPGYSGAEHYELPHEFPEPGEDRNGNGQCDTNEACTGSACVRTICNWYSLNEAAAVTDPNVPHWTACARNRMAWARRVRPTLQEEGETSLRLVYEAPITKESDGGRDGATDGDLCHQDYLFADGIRRPVFLRLGYVLHADRPFFDRTYQLDNPAGNPAFGQEVWSVIGGLVLSKLPASQPAKAALFHTVRPELRDVSGPVPPYTFPAGQWTARPAKATADEAWGWLATPISWSARGRASYGDSLKLELLGPADNDDTGFCLCNTHGGMEIGGGVLHRGVSLPIEGGTRTLETTRRISFPSEHALPFVHEAEGESLFKLVGRGEADGWSANTAEDPPGWLIHGPYASHWGDGPKTAVFRLMVDSVVTGGNVVSLDVYDATAGQVIAKRVLSRAAFTQPFMFHDFSLGFSLDGRLGHAIETRVYWHDISYVKVDRISVTDR